MSLAVCLLLSACYVDSSATTDSGQPSDEEVVPPEEHALEVQRLQELEALLRDLVKVNNLGNDAHEATQAYFDSPDIYSAEAFELLETAREAWNAAGAQLEVFTREDINETDSLEPGIKVLEVAVDAWNDFFNLAERVTRLGGGRQEEVDRLMALQEYASGEAVAGMDFIAIAQEDIVALICDINEGVPACFLNTPPSP